MAIKYYPIPEKRQVVAVLSNTQYDAYNKIDKMMKETGFCFAPHGSREYNKYMMPDTFKVTLTCDERDVYDVEEGKKIAKKKLMRNYRKSLNKRIATFKKSFDRLVDTVNVKID